MEKQGIPVIDGFALKGKIYLDNRCEVDSVSELVNLECNHYPDGFIAYVRNEDKYFKYDSRKEATAETGRWKETNITDHKPPYVDEETHTLYL